MGASSTVLLLIGLYGFTCAWRILTAKARSLLMDNKRFTWERQVHKQAACCNLGLTIPAALGCQPFRAGGTRFQSRFLGSTTANKNYFTSSPLSQQKHRSLSSVQKRMQLQPVSMMLFWLPRCKISCGIFSPLTAKYCLKRCYV